MFQSTERGGKPFHSFDIVLKILVIAGFYEVQSSRKYVRVCHYIYRVLVILMMFIYNLQHIIFMYMHVDNVKLLVNSLVIEIPMFNVMGKILTIFIFTPRLRYLHSVINDPIFEATNKTEIEYIQSNYRNITKLSKLLCISIGFGCTTWILSFVFMRLDNPAEATVPSYMPFDTTSTIGYAFSIVMETSPILWIGYGHIFWDCVIATYYSQATTQLKILKHNLEHIFDSNVNGESWYDSKCKRRFQYIDEVDASIRDRFIYNVEKYRRITWYIEETSAIFDRSISLQFFTTTASACLVIYNLSTLPIFSAMFLHMFIILIIFKGQVFLYCFYGYLVEYESQSINTAVYFSDWLSVSPRFRRTMLVAMTRWDKPLTPRVSMIIPLSVVTFVSIIKSAYRLYTVMKSTRM